MDTILATETDGEEIRKGVSDEVFPIEKSTIGLRAAEMPPSPFAPGFVQNIEVRSRSPSIASTAFLFLEMELQYTELVSGAGVSHGASSYSYCVLCGFSNPAGCYGLLFAVIESTFVCGGVGAHFQR